MSISIPANTQLQKVGTVQLGALPYDAYIAMPEGVSFDPMSKTAQKVQTRLHRYLLAQAKREDFISTKPGRHAEFASQDSRIAMKIEDEGMKDGQGKVIRGNNATINLAQGTNASGMGTNLLAGEKEHSWSGVLGDLRKRLTTDKGCPTTVAVSVLWEDLKDSISELCAECNVTLTERVVHLNPHLPSTSSPISVATPQTPRQNLRVDVPASKQPDIQVLSPKNIFRTREEAQNALLSSTPVGTQQALFAKAAQDASVMYTCPQPTIVIDMPESESTSRTGQPQTPHRNEIESPKGSASFEFEKPLSWDDRLIRFIQDEFYDFWQLDKDLEKRYEEQNGEYGQHTTNVFCNPGMYELYYEGLCDSLERLFDTLETDLNRSTVSKTPFFASLASLSTIR